jgi:hypothetical protein
MDAPKTVNIRLAKLENGTALRTTFVDGFCYELPKVGQSFVMYSESLEFKGGARFVQTSEVQSVLFNNEVDVFTIKTMNSVYSLKILPDVPPNE